MSALRWYSAFASAVLVVALSPWAWAGSSGSAGNGCCKKPDNEIKRVNPYVEVDANTGRILYGTLNHSEGPVQVVFTRKNPFKYVYRFQVESAPLSQSIIKDVLSVFPGIGPIVPQLRGVSGPQAPGGEACTSPQLAPRWKEVKDKAKDVESAASALTALLAIHQSAEAFFTKTDREFLPVTECPSVCDEASSLVSNLPKLIGADPTVLKKTWQEYRERTDALKEAVKVFTTAFDAASDAEKQNCDVKDESSRIPSTVDSDLQKFTSAVDTVDQNKQKLELLLKLLQSFLVSDTPFEEEYQLTDDTANTITVYRQNLRDPNGKEMAVGSPLHLDVGESKFSLSLGIALTSMDEPKIIREPYLKPDDTVGVRFGEENSSPFVRPKVLVALNGRVFKQWGVTTGLVVGFQNEESTLGFLFGAAWYFHKDLLLNFGYHLGQVHKLGDGFQLGQDIPASITDPLPTQTDWDDGVMVGLTYRFR